MRLDPNKIPIVVGAYEGDVSYVSVDGVEIPQSDYSVSGPIVILNDGREFSLGDFPVSQ